MKIACLSDTHGLHKFVKFNEEADVLIIAGDLGGQTTMREFEDFLNWLEDLDFDHKIFIAGNHDFFLEKYRPINLPDNIHYLLDEEVIINGVKFYGSPWTPFYYDWAFMKERGAELAAVWKNIPYDVDILITHGPPKGILDVTKYYEQCGDADLLEAVLKKKPRLHVFGHIHESRGQQYFEGIDFINAAFLDLSYRPTNNPTYYELDETYLKDHTRT